MLDRFQDIDEKLADLEGRLSDPSLINNQQEYQKVVKEHAHLSKLSELLDSYRDIEQQIAQGEDPGLKFLVRQAWLRTVSRPPSADESQRAIEHLESAESPVDGLRDLLWALLNTKEFLLIQ